jgi:ADP-ribose pyrophosphatase YjhB (NUDIX family)
MNSNPKKVVVALVLIQEGGKLLLVRQNYGERYWSLPGGMIEDGESITEASIREVREETGLRVVITRVVGLYSLPEDNSLAITLEGKVEGGKLNPDYEILECKYFPFDKLPTHVREHFHQRVEDYFLNAEGAFLRSQ